MTQGGSGTSTALTKNPPRADEKVTSPVAKHTACGRHRSSPNVTFRVTCVAPTKPGSVRWSSRWDETSWHLETLGGKNPRFARYSRSQTPGSPTHPPMSSSWCGVKNARERRARAKCVATRQRTRVCGLDDAKGDFLSECAFHRFGNITEKNEKRADRFKVPAPAGPWRRTRSSRRGSPC